MSRWVVVMTYGYDMGGQNVVFGPYPTHDQAEAVANEIDEFIDLDEGFLVSVAPVVPSANRWPLLRRFDRATSTDGEGGFGWPSIYELLPRRRQPKGDS